jgi:anti-sigma factor RsiW
MKCPIEAREDGQLLGYCDGSLSAERKAAVAAHLQGCAPCQEFVARQSMVWEAMDGWEAPPVSLGFDRRLYQRIEQEVSWWDLLVRPFRPLLTRRSVPIAATSLLVLVAGLMFQNPMPVTPVKPPASAQVDGMPPEQLEHVVDEMELMREFNRLVRVDATDPKM